jgi:predicted nucleotidyltransferase
MTLEEILGNKRGEILRLAREHGAGNVRVFGSAARGEAGPQSDIDFLVDMEEGRSLLDLIGFWQDLEDLLNRKVDVLSEGGIHPYLRDRIISEARPL